MTIAFQTRDECLGFLRSLDNYIEHADGEFSGRDLYHRNYGEYSRPDYKPCLYDDGWGIKATYYYHPGTIYAPTDGRCDVEEVCGTDGERPVYTLCRASND